MYYRISLFILFLNGIIGFGQTVQSFRFSTQNGLPSNKIYAVIEDKEGFIWCATDRGVTRYDGVSFTNFTTLDGLHDNDILNLVEDGKGRIWFISFAREPTYFYKGKIYHSGNDSFLSKLKAGKHPLPTIYFWDVDDSMIYFKVGQNESSYFITKDREEEIRIGNYVGTGGISMGLMKRLGKDHFEIFDGFGYTEYYHQKAHRTNWDRINLVHQKNKLGYYLYWSFQNGWGWLDLKNKKFIKIDSEKARFVGYDSKAELVYVLKDSMIFKRNAITGSKQDQLKISIMVNGVCVGKMGSLWLNSSSQGLYKISKNYSRVIFGGHDKTITILKVAKFQDELYLGTDGFGIIRISKSGEKVYLGLESKLDRILEIKPCGGKLYFGTDNGLWVLTENKKNIKQIYGASVKDLECFENSQLIMASAGGTWRVMNELITPYYLERSTCAYKINENEIWIGGLTGLYRYKIKDKKFELISNTGLLSYSTLSDIKQDQYGNIWISTTQNGLFFYSPSTGFKQLGYNNNAISKSVAKKILIDNNKGIWVAGNFGLMRVLARVAKQNVQFSYEIYGVSDGLPNKELFDVAYGYQGLFVTTRSGCYDYFPSKNQYFTSKVLVESVLINGAKWDDINLLHLKHYQNNIELLLSASFIEGALGAYHFSYRIKEFGKDWLDLYSTQLPLNFLLPGKYTVEVRAVGNHGQKGPVTVLPIVIKGVWYKSVWIMVVISLFLMAVILYYIKQEASRLRLSSELASMKLRVIRAQLNPHFLFNSLSNIQYFIYTKKNEEASNYINDMAFILRKSLDYSSVDVISLKQELEYLRIYVKLEMLRFEDKFEFKTDIHLEEGYMHQILVPSLFLQPLVENSIKHGFKGIHYLGKILLKVSKTHDRLIVELEDNGVGMHVENSKSGSYGLGFTEDRLKLLSESNKIKPEFKIISPANQGKGTKIIINMALHYR